MRRFAFVLAVAAAVGAWRVEARQDWKPAALASFDAVWQTVSDTYFDPSFGGVDWAAVHAELRPKAEAAASIDEVRAVTRQMLARLHASHLALIPAAGGAGDDPTSGAATVPIDVRLVPTDTIAGMAAGADAPLITRAGASLHAAGVEAGDVVTSIDGASTIFPRDARTPDDRAWRLELWKRITRELHGPEGTTATLGVANGGVLATAHAARAEEPGEIVQLGNLPPFHVRVDAREEKTPGGRRVAVIGFNVWMAAIDAPVAAAVDRFRGADGIVIDLRGNPGGLAFMIDGIAGHFLDDAVTLGTSKMRTAQLKFVANPRRATADGRAVVPFAGPLAILIDEMSASASECFAGALQSLGRARVFGQTSMGAALPALTKILPDGDVLEYAAGDFVTSTGRRLEGVGVVPDEMAPPTPEALRAGRDRALDAALAWMDKRPN